MDQAIPEEAVLQKDKILAHLFNKNIITGCAIEKNEIHEETMSESEKRNARQDFENEKLYTDPFMV